MKWFLPVLASIVAVIAVAAVVINSGDSGENNEQFDTPVQEPSGINGFSWDVFDTQDDTNIFYSPYGLYTALGMLLNGAEPDSLTEKELLRVLHARDKLMVNDGVSVINSLLTKDTKYKFSSSDMILIDKTYVTNRTINENFKKIIEEVYDGSVDKVDIANNAAGVREMIKKWVDEKTNGFIPDYESILDNSTLVDILNVVYFKGGWEYPFDSQFTFKRSFTNSDGTVTSTDMMYKKFSAGSIGYYTDGKYKGISLPYVSEGGVALSMIIVLPTDGSLDIKEKWSSESTEYREAFMEKVRNGNAGKSKIDVVLPKLEMELSYDLKEVFSALGMNISMSNAAEFTDIIDGEYLKISDGKHQAKVKVDEKGTEAAAVTEIVLKNTAFIDTEPVVYFHCDIPYVFTITEGKYGTDLFAGYVSSLDSEDSKE